MNKEILIKIIKFITFPIICFGVGCWIAYRPIIKNDDRKRLVDSLTIITQINQQKYESLCDSIQSINKAHMANFFMIEQLKKTIRDEINKQKIKIYSTPDSCVQHLVDSIRSASGFH